MIPDAVSSDISTRSMDREKPRFAALRSWGKVIGGAVLAATFLRACVFEAYRIPSSSMADTLQVNDYVFVSKLTYGARIFGVRMPGLGEVERGDVAVFNYPPEQGPIEQRTPYIKRVVGLPGDTVALVAKGVRVNGEPMDAPALGRQLWRVRTLPRGLPLMDTLRAIGIDGRIQRSGRQSWVVEARPIAAEALTEFEDILDVRPYIRDIGDGSAGFPAAFRYSLDDYGPLVVPYAGLTIPVTLETWPLVREVAERLEGRITRRTARGFEIDSVLVDTYTFSRDYLFVLGDNRDDSADSRAWGFVPTTHLIGRAARIYFSWDDVAQSPRWDRIGLAVE
ncbi:MAG: signal peptidase I [Bacteroidota bacterium]